MMMMTWMAWMTWWSVWRWWSCSNVAEKNRFLFNWWFFSRISSKILINIVPEYEGDGAPYDDDGAGGGLKKDECDECDECDEWDDGALYDDDGAPYDDDGTV